MPRKDASGVMAAAALALAGVPAAAESMAAGKLPGKFYAGLEVGRSESDVDLHDAVFGPTIARHEGNSTGLKARIGYQFVRYVALEGGYVNFGEYDINNVPYTCPTGMQGPCTFDFRSESHGAYVNVVGSVPFAKNWAVNGRMGLSVVSGTTHQRDPGIQGSERSFERDTTGVMYGLGVSYRITQTIEAELAWSRFDQIGFPVTVGGEAVYFDFGNAQLFSLGARYRF
jgi:opacity protein-like surface antigen